MSDELLPPEPTPPGRPGGGKRRHGRDCSCVRCQGFQPGHQINLRHGAFSKAGVLRLQPRTREIAAAIRGQVPAYNPGHDVLVDVYSIALRRFELAIEALEDFETRAEERGAPVSAIRLSEGYERLRRLEQDARGWANSALRYADALGLTPSAAARVARDLGLAKDAGVRGQRALEEYLAERYGPVVNGGEG